MPEEKSENCETSKIVYLGYLKCLNSALEDKRKDVASAMLLETVYELGRLDSKCIEVTEEIGDLREINLLIVKNELDNARDKLHEHIYKISDSYSDKELQRIWETQFRKHKQKNI